MMSSFQTSKRFLVIALLALLMAAGGGCKSKKKAMEAARAEAERAKLEQAALDRQKQEELRKREADEKARRESETTAREPREKLDLFFNAIANSANAASANSSIQEALSLFTSPQTPVLIVISEEGGQKDYDRPTTIADYLNYLKDQKKNANKISNVQYDSSGLITELELTKE